MHRAGKSRRSSRPGRAGRRTTTGRGRGEGSGIDAHDVPGRGLATAACRIRPGPFVVMQSPAPGPGDTERTATMADNHVTGEARPFRFGVVAPVRTDLPAWRDQVRRIADSG